MMWIEERQSIQLDDSLDSSGGDANAGEELPIWVRGEQRWVSGIVEATTCTNVVDVLLQDEKNRGRHVGSADQYHVTERWRGVEQPLDNDSKILEIWTAWGPAQTEVKMSLRRIKYERTSSRKTRHHKSDNSVWSDKGAFKTVHPKRISALQNEKQPSNTEELLKLVLAQGEVIRKQLKKLRNSENQIGVLEDKTHRARVRKHGSNYLLETYLKGLSEAVDPASDSINCQLTDKNSDSGVVTEGDSDQNKPSCSAESSFERFSPSSHEFNAELKDDDTSSTISEATVREQLDLFERLAKLNKRLLREEETLVRLHATMKKYDQNQNYNNQNNNAIISNPGNNHNNAIISNQGNNLISNPGNNQQFTNNNNNPVSSNPGNNNQQAINNNYNSQPVLMTDDITHALTSLRTQMAKGSCELQHNEVVLEETGEAIGGGRSQLDLLYRDLSNEDKEFEMLQTLLYSHSLKSGEVITATKNNNDLFTNNGFMTNKIGSMTTNNDFISHNGHTTNNNGCMTNNNGCVTNKNCFTSNHGYTTSSNSCVANKNGFTSNHGCITSNNGCLTSSNGCLTSSNGCLTSSNVCLTSKSVSMNSKDSCEGSNVIITSGNRGGTNSKVTPSEGLLLSGNVGRYPAQYNTKEMLDTLV